MPREVLKPINSAYLNTCRRGMNESVKIDKENLVNRDVTQQLSNGAIPKFFPVKGILKNKLPSNTDSNTSSSSSSLSVLSSSKHGKEKQHIKFKPDSTYSIMQFSVYDEEIEDIPEISIKTEHAEEEDGSSFDRSRNFFMNQERAAVRKLTEIKSPVAKRALAKKSTGESFKKAKETFLVHDEAVKVRKRLDSILRKENLRTDNSMGALCRRIAELKIEDVDYHQDSTPYDVNNVPPLHEPIKVLHKNSNVDSIIRPNSALPSYSLCEVNSLLYHEDIMNFFLEKEKSCRRIHPNFRRQNTTLAQHQLIISHLLKIIKDYNYSSFIGYQAARLFNDMLDAKRITIEQLQLVELTSLWIVMKNLLLAYVVPEASKIVSFSDGAYTEADLFLCERDIMKTLNFEISYPDPFTVLNFSLFSHQNCIFLPKNIDFIYYSGSYMLDVALFDEQLMSLSPTLLGCAAAELALIVNLATHEAFRDPTNSPWRAAFAKKHFKGEVILHAQQLILRHIASSGYRGSPEHIVYKKYKRSRYGRISYSLILNVTKLIP